jgi:hypothetical protein
MSRLCDDATQPVVLGLAVARTLQARLAELMAATSRRWLHLLNLPAGTDVTRLLQQLDSLERELGRLERAAERTRSRATPPLT